MTADNTKKLFLNENDLSNLKEYFSISDNFNLEFSRLQSKKFRNNLSSFTYTRTLDNFTAFRDIQKMHYDELAIHLYGWCRNYNFKDSLENQKIKHLIPNTKEKYGKDFDFFEILDSLIFTGCFAILIKDEEDDIEVCNKIQTINLISEIFEVKTSIILKVEENFMFEKMSIYYDIVDIIWIQSQEFNENFLKIIKKSFDKSNKILGYTYSSPTTEKDKILSDLGFLFSEIEPGWIPTAKLEFS
jgi:hypothetical protein